MSKKRQNFAHRIYPLFPLPKNYRIVVPISREKGERTILLRFLEGIGQLQDSGPYIEAECAPDSA
jgi:hypothetical protein